MLDKFISCVMQGRPFGSRAARSNYIYHIRPRLNVDVVTEGRDKQSFTHSSLPLQKVMCVYKFCFVLLGVFTIGENDEFRSKAKFAFLNCYQFLICLSKSKLNRTYILQ